MRLKINDVSSVKMVSMDLFDLFLFSFCLSTVLLEQPLVDIR